MPIFDTAANIVSDAAKELGLITSAVSDPYTSTDTNVQRLTALLTSLGQDLGRNYHWSQLQKEKTFSTSNGTATYALPTDFERFVDGSAWNRSSTFPLAGPLSPAMWQLIQANSSTSTVQFWFRIWANQMQLYPTPSSTQTVAYEYRSTYWVVPTGQTAPTLSAPTAKTDTLWFDRLLLVRGLKVAFKAATGQESSAAADDFNRTLQDCLNGDGAAQTLNLAGGGLYKYRLIDNSNSPESGYGS